MIKMKKISLLSLILALALVISMAGCGKNEPVPQEPDPDPDVQVDISGLVFMNPLLIPEGSSLQDAMPNLIPKVLEKNEQNSDTVGWLQVPNTNINDVVVQSPTDTNNVNAFYLRRDFDKRQNDNGTYFVDYRSGMGPTRDSLSRNTIIYGHSMSDNVNGSLMDQLKRFRSDIEFAEANPYLFFSLEEENLMWEIFAVFDTGIDFHYNNPNPTADEFAELVSEAERRSYYSYDVQVTAGDKIITLSTCTYNITSVYPNDYRFVVMARLVAPDEVIRETAPLVVNADRKPA